MTPSRTLVLADTPERCSGVLEAGDAQGTLMPLLWTDLELAGTEGLMVDAILCEATPELAQRRGLLSLLRRAYPEAPFFSFSHADPSARMHGAGLGLDGHLIAPIALDNLSLLISREGRIRTLTRRYRESLDRVREQSEKLDVLVETAKGASSLLDPERVMQLVMDRTQEFLGAEGWTFYLLVESPDGTDFVVTRGGFGREVMIQQMSAERGIAAWVVKHRRPLVIDDVLRDPRWAEESPRPGEIEVRSLLCIPLFSRGRVIGAVEILNKAGGGPFGERDVESLRTMMEPSAITIENAMLFKKLEEMSVTDDLTRLYNSRYLNHFLQQEVKRSKRYGYSVSLLFLDLDGFKAVNDRYGHLAGSRTLVEVGKVIRTMVRETDIVSRYGGDEFTVVLPQTGIEGATVIAGRVREGLQDHSFLETVGLSVHLTASVGIACYPHHGETREDLIGHADRAMYRVKQRGKNGIELAFQEQGA